MRQVPNYVIIGNGRMATHFCHYLNNLSVPFTHWYRKAHDETKLQAFSKDYSHFVLLIKDSAIEGFIHEHVCLKHKTLIHFSGSLAMPNAFSTHPLYTFGHHLYTTSQYRNIVFITPDNNPKFSELFPALPNQAYTIPTHLKPLYHALCVMSGNFTTLLWNKCFAEFEEKLHIPKEAAYSYLEQIMNNLVNDPKNALTGPFIRNDDKTIQNNLAALREDPYQSVYRAFAKVYQKKSK